jgi:hypothetical protein
LSCEAVIIPTVASRRDTATTAFIPLSRVAPQS